MPKQKLYIFLGASLRGSSREESKQRAAQIKKICAVLNAKGCDYDADSLLDSELNIDNHSRYTPPKQYFQNISPSLIKSVIALRPDNDEDKIRYNIACYRWSTSLIEKADAAIWYLGRSNNGTGYEIAYATQKLRTPSLVFFDMPEISSMISGCTDRNLVVKRWGDDHVNIIENFIDKVESGVDQTARFNVTQQVKRWIDSHDNPSEYLRNLVELDMAMRAES